MRVTMQRVPINERRHAARTRTRRSGVDDQARSWKHVRAVPMIQRPVTPNDIVMQRLHRAEGDGRASALARQRRERLARPLCVRALRREPMHYLTRWDTDTPFAVSPAA